MFRKTIPIEKPENVKSLKQLIEYVSFLADGLQSNPKNWENITLEDYLRSISRWIEDSATLEGKAKKLTCEEVANLFYVGKVYE